MSKTICLAVLLAFLLTLFVPATSLLAAGVTVDADIVSYANFVHSQQRFSCYAEDRYWVFWPEGGNILYNTSLDGAAWDGAVDTGLNVGGTYANALGMAMAQVGSYVHFARTTSATQITYTRVLLLGNGSIEVGANYVAVNHPGAYGGLHYPSIGISTDDCPFIAYQYHDGGSGQLYVSRSSTGDGVWTTDAGYPLRLSTGFVSSIWVSSIEPLNNGRMLVVFTNGLSSYPYLYARSYSGTGTTWNGIVQSAGQPKETYFSTVSVGDSAYIVYLRKTVYDIRFLSYSYATNTFSTEQSLATNEGQGPPVIAYTPDAVLRVYWIGTDKVWGIASVAGSYTAWSDVFELMAESISDTRGLHVDDSPYIVPWGVYYVGTGDVLKIAVDDGGYTVGAPFGVAIDATDITAYSATLNAVCTWDGGGNTTAKFMWGCPVQDGNVTYDGYVTSGEYFSGNATNLVPSQTYGFWVVFTNGYGEYWTSPVVYFNTEAESGYDYPLVVTYPNNPATGDVGETSAKLYGYLSYDGNLDCQVGFQYRVDGASTWITGWNSGVYHTAMQIRGVLSNLQKNTTYEYRAVAQNAMSLPGDPSYGVTLEFTTSYYAPTPAGGVGLGDLLPESIRHYFENWNPMVKMILALVITIGGMALLAAKLPRAKAGGLAVAAYGGLATVGFLIAGWYPQWVLIFLGAVVGVTLLLIVLGGRK